MNWLFCWHRYEWGKPRDVEMTTPVIVNGIFEGVYRTSFQLFQLGACKKCGYVKERRL